MFVKIIAPIGEFKQEGTALCDIIAVDREFYLNINTVTSIHIIADRLYLDRLRITFESNQAAQNAVTALFEAMSNNNPVTEISHGVVVLKALSGCKVCMQNGQIGEADNGPEKRPPVESDETETAKADETEVTE